MNQSFISPTSMIQTSDFSAEPISIEAVANRTFAADAHGRGWTDQGSENDLHVFCKENLRFQNFRFDILPPEKAQCLAISSRFPDFVKEIEVETKNRKGDYLVLLHAGAWLEDSVAGTLTVEYTDGTSSQFDIEKGRDICDWSRPKSGNNCKLAWFDMDRGRYRCLVVSAFPLQNKALDKVKFLSGKRSIWLIAALSCVQCNENPVENLPVPRFLDSEAQTFCWTDDPISAVPGAKFLGFLKPKSSSEIGKSPVGIGFETLDRDTFDPEQVYDALGASGIKHARVQCGWRKCEPKPGIYDFTWLDSIVDNLWKRGVDVWLQLSFGNPLYTPNKKYDAYKKLHPDEEPASGFLRGFVPDTPYYHGPEAMKAWLKFTVALTEHYCNRVREYEIWNEPDGTGLFWGINGESPYSGISRAEELKRMARDYFDFARQTAEAVRSVYPEAVIVSCPAVPHGVYMRELGKLGFGKIIDVLACHTYDVATQAFDRTHYEQIRAIIKPKAMWMGEGGSPAKAVQLSSPLASLYTASELSQAKHNARRLTADAGCGMLLSSIYTMSDFKSYWFDGNDSVCGIFHRKEARPKLAYYAMQSIAVLFDGVENAPELGIYPKIPINNCSVLEKNALQCFSFRKKGIPLFAVFSPEIEVLNPEPINCSFELSMDGREITEPVVIDPLRQKVYSISGTYTDDDAGILFIPQLAVPNYPLFITDRSAVELQ